MQRHFGLLATMSTALAMAGAITLAAAWRPGEAPLAPAGADELASAGQAAPGHALGANTLMPTGFGLGGLAHIDARRDDDDDDDDDD